MHDKMKHVGEDFDVSDDFEMERVDDGLLEDLFVKGEIPRIKDPFNFNFNNKNKKEELTKGGDAFDSLTTNATANPVKYSRLPNGMILNHDKDSLKK